MKPVESAFQSALAPWLRDFVLEKRAVGYRYDVEQRLLQRIDRLVVEHGHHEATLPMAVLEAWRTLDDGRVQGAVRDHPSVPHPAFEEAPLKLPEFRAWLEGIEAQGVERSPL